jgi:hypothetical protein
MEKMEEVAKALGTSVINQVSQGCTLNYRGNQKFLTWKMLQELPIETLVEQVKNSGS